MNRYPLWKYLLIGLVIVVSAIYALPNLYGETPAVQVSTNRQSIHIDQTTEQAVAEALKAANIQHNGMFIADGSLRVRLPNEELQSKARDVIEQKLGDNYIIALNLIANTPDWMTKLGANPMFLGLDLRGGVHFTMRVDMHAAVDKTFDRISGDFRRQLRKDKIRTGNMRRSGDTLIVPFQDAATLQVALPKLKEIAPDVELKADGNNLVVSLPETTQTQIRDAAVKQNINTLHNRVNELGVAEPIIQQAGPDRIVVQLPGVQDTAKAKDIIGRTATLEVALCKRPMVISYKISPLTYALVKHKIKVPYVGLPNVLLGRAAVPELLQHDAEPEKLAAALLNWYRSPEKTAALQQDFTELHRLLRKDTAAEAAAAVLAAAGANP